MSGWGGNIRNRAIIGGGLILGLLGVVLGAIQQLDYSPFDREAYLTTQQILFIRPGLDLEVLEVDIAPDGTVAVDFMITDDKGLPLDIDGIFTPGEVSASFVLARIPEGETHYVAYTTRTQTSPITGESAIQPTADSGGTFTKLSDGQYRYTFNTKLPADFDADATHSIGIYAERDLSEFDLGEQVDNEVVDFVPSGGELPAIHDVVSTESCNQCHDPLAVHGGVRQDVELCVLCHYEGVIDPDTGNSVDMKVMIHKIHRGENLPSVEAGMPYQIIGFRQSVHDYSDVVFPQDIRNCDTCHRPPAEQHEAWLLRPTRATCGSCHDDVNFATGENHPGGPTISDNFCSLCHFPEGELEFDSSIMGAHTVPSQSSQLPGINIEILDVQNTNPGDNPTVFFTLTNDAGETLLPSDLSNLNLAMAGPTTDYSFLSRENAQDASIPLDGGFTYTFEEPLPGDAVGTFAVSAEARRNILLNEGTTEEFSQREAAENPVFYFGVTDLEPAPRRMVVSEANCEMCHNQLSLHGDQRNNPEYCVFCHHPAADDAARRPLEEFPARTIDFKFLVHRIHRGEDLEREFTVFGFGGTPHDYTEVLYPGDLRNCAKCHVDQTFQVPSAGILPTVAAREFFSPIPPNSAACLGCHDDVASAAHAFLQIAPFGEACGVCHSQDAEFSVTRVHAR